ncbi:MAG: TolC family protein [Deltaproteobacteria bacterium]|nr:TolC family protein [Deltaproteobacteria bacterium]
MAQAFAHPGDPAGRRFALNRTNSPNSHQIRRGLGVILALSLVVLILGVLGSPEPTLAAEPDPVEAKIALQGSLDYDACARLAIRQSPYLTKTSVEIDIRQLDEADSRHSMVPPLTFRSYYYVDRPNQPGLNPKPYSLNFSMDPYNPFGSYFTLQAQKMATRMAVFGHLKVISDGLERIGKMFLNLATTKRLAGLQADLVNLSRENLVYAENRLSIGTGTSLEVRIATQELELAKSEQSRLGLSQKRTSSSLKTFLGLKPDQQVDFDLRDAHRQVTGSFDPAAATLEQAKEKSYELKLLELKKEMQGYMITVAKARIFPSILFTTQTPDPLSVTSARGLYVGLGLEVPVWDGLKRFRNVSRQKAVLKQISTEKDLKEIDLTDKWNTLQEEFRSAAANLKLAQGQEELDRLKERQGEIRYQSGTEPLPSWLAARKAILEAQKSAAARAQEYDESILNLRVFSGDLGNSYVDQNSWQK